MTQPTESYLKVPYDLRPAKQIERRMLIDAFQRLSMARFPMASYQYTGFGSIYFVDFILFHKLLGIDNLLSVEYSTRIKKRVHFNRPFLQVKIEIKPIGDVIPSLSRDRRHILWLDYDDILRASHLADVVLAGTYLTVGSILLITIDVEPPAGDSPSDWREHFVVEAGDYLGGSSKLVDFAKSKLPLLNTSILEVAIKRGLAGREAKFIPLFNFVYADGHRMLTVGGIIGTDQEERDLQASTLVRAPYYRSDLRKPPYEILVPRLTRKERLYLDCSMPCSDLWKPKDFELSAKDILAYREIYRFFPAYAELLL